MWKRVELPVIQCKPNCGQCCGPVTCKESEFQAVERYAKEHGIVPLDQGTTCPFYQNGGCAVYPVRPFVCKMFGHCERLTCPHGINVNISIGLERKINESYGQPTRCLHELVPSFMERFEKRNPVTAAVSLPR